MFFPAAVLRYVAFLLLPMVGRSLANPPPDSLTQTDLNDLSRRWFNVSIAPKAELGLSTRPQWAFLPSVNVSPATGIAGGAIVTTAFYPKNSPPKRLSAAGMYLGYSQFNQLIVAAISNIWTPGYRYNIQGDWRFYNFPTTTYGLGGASQLTNASLVDYNHIRFYQTLYRAIGRDYMVGTGVMVDHHFGIKNTSTDGLPTDFERYGKTSRSTSSGLSVGLLRDRRDNPNNPYGGSYLLAQLRLYSTVLGSTASYQALWLDYRRYVPLGGRRNNQLAFWAFNWSTFGGKVPYLDLPATGWDTSNNTGRGYIMGRLRGPSYHYAEAEYRAAFTANGLIGGVLFANVQAIGPWPGGVPAGLDEATQHRPLRTWPGVGGGLRLKVNKATRTNLAIDYGIGAGGSQGLYFNLNEVF